MAGEQRLSIGCKSKKFEIRRVEFAHRLAGRAFPEPNGRIEGRRRQERTVRRKGDTGDFAGVPFILGEGLPRVEVPKEKSGVATDSEGLAVGRKSERPWGGAFEGTDLLAGLGIPHVEHFLIVRREQLAVGRK